MLAISYDATGLENTIRKIQSTFKYNKFDELDGIFDNAYEFGTEDDYKTKSFPRCFIK
jgi:hypothetical protein